MELEPKKTIIEATAEGLAGVGFVSRNVKTGEVKEGRLGAADSPETINLAISAVLQDEAESDSPNDL